MMLSRAADSLYWMSRYLERAEHTARLVDVALDLTYDRSPEAIDLGWQRLREALGEPEPEQTDLLDLTIAEHLVFSETNPNALVSCIKSARENARQIRELISSEMWEQVNRLYLHVQQTQPDDAWRTQPHAFFQDVKRGIYLFQGISDSTMNHGEGWQFIRAGRYIERAGGIATLLMAHRDSLNGSSRLSSDTDAYLDLVGLLRNCTAFEAYCKVYTAMPRPTAIVEFLLLNQDFPHSMAFSIRSLSDALHFIATQTDQHKHNPVNRRVGRLRARLEYDQIDEIMTDGLPGYLSHIRQECIAIHTSLYQTYIQYRIQDKTPA